MTQDYAKALADAFREGRLIAPVPDRVVPDDAAAADLQRAAIAALGARIVGWKIGATTAKAQAIMKAAGPFYGPILEGRVWPDGSDVDLPAGFRGFECEFALRLGADLPARDGGYTVDQLGIAIDAVIPAIEIVATRQDVEGMGHGRLAWADFGFNHGLVLGAPQMPPPLDALADAVVIARVAADEVGRGTGADVLGHPLEAVAWLTRQGVPLEAGQLVSTGTCTGIAKVVTGQSAVGDFGPFGEVSFRAT